MYFLLYFLESGEKHSFLVAQEEFLIRELFALRNEASGRLLVATGCVECYYGGLWRVVSGVLVGS